MNKDNLAKRALFLKKKIEKFGEVYAELDAIAEKLKGSGSVKIEGGELFVVDNFKSGKTTMYRTTSFKRYEIAFIKGGKKE